MDVAGGLLAQLLASEATIEMISNIGGRVQRGALAAWSPARSTNRARPPRWQSTIRAAPFNTLSPARPTPGPQQTFGVSWRKTGTRDTPRMPGRKVHLTTVTRLRR